jgi:hypothetical protein
MSAKERVIEAARRVWGNCGLLHSPDGRKTRVVCNTDDINDLRDALMAYDARRAELNALTNQATGG